MFEQKVHDADRVSELRRVNEVLREKRKIGLVRMNEELVPEKQAEPRP